jgi:MoaA/NifB/PqqE/SkfB family radical SAM enzyme
MLVGFAVTEHCNLRCPHCIRDDVTTVCCLDEGLIESIIDQALELYGPIVASFTGGEPLLHPEFERIARIVADRGVPYRFVTNGWHWSRIASVLDRHPPQSVRLSLSGADEAVHDGERGRGSFRRVLQSVAILTSRRIPAYLSIVVDRRDRHQLREAADLAESLGCIGISFILPQPTPGSAARDSDLPPEEWMPVRQEVEALAAEPRRSLVQMDYGAPFHGVEAPCQTFALERVYIDSHGRLCTCCQLSDYGFNAAEFVADLRTTSLAEAHGQYVERLARLKAAQRPDPLDAKMTDPFPCLRCAEACGKLRWLERYPRSAWHPSAGVAATV